MITWLIGFITYLTLNITGVYPIPTAPQPDTNDYTSICEQGAPDTWGPYTNYCTERGYL